MRIALIAPPWVPVPPTAYGGTETIVDALARGFQSAGHDVLLFTTGDSTCPVKREWILPEADKTRLNWSEVELRHVIAAYEAVGDFDVVHDHTIVGPSYGTRFPNLPIVMTQHHPFDDRFYDICRATHQSVPIVAISHHQASLARGLKIRDVIHHGLNPNDFTYQEKPEDYFVFLGRMSPNKGAARAAAVAKAAGVKLKIAARISENEGEREYFEKEVKPLLGDGIEFIGETTVAEKPELLRKARGLINPIRWPEPFGLVMIEALASGTPVITFKEGAAPEIVTHRQTGFLCDDIGDMVDAVRRIDEINRMDCRLAVETYFSTDRMVRDYIRLFSELTAESQAPKAEVIDLPGSLVPPNAAIAVGAKSSAATRRKPLRTAISKPWPAVSNMPHREA